MQEPSSTAGICQRCLKNTELRERGRECSEKRWETEFLLTFKMRGFFYFTKISRRVIYTNQKLKQTDVAIYTNQKLKQSDS